VTLNPVLLKCTVVFPPIGVAISTPEHLTLENVSLSSSPGVPRIRMTIISFEHKFIFIKTRKVAGTSVEACLRTVTGPDDIIACVTPRDEFYSASEGHFSKNYARHKADEEHYTELVLEQKFEEAIQLSRNMKKNYASHMTARTVRRKLGRRDYSDFYKFAIERHPHSWLISLAAYENRAYNAGVASVMSVEQIRQNIRDRLARSDFAASMNYRFYTISDKLAVNRLISYESLEQELEDVLEDIGVDSRLTLPRMKENSQHNSTEEIITPEIEALIAEKCQKVFELMRYR